MLCLDTAGFVHLKQHRNGPLCHIIGNGEPCEAGNGLKCKTIVDSLNLPINLNTLSQDLILIFKSLESKYLEIKFLLEMRNSGLQLLGVKTPNPTPRILNSYCSSSQKRSLGDILGTESRIIDPQVSKQKISGNLFFVKKIQKKFGTKNFQKILKSN